MFFSFLLRKTSGKSKNVSPERGMEITHKKIRENNELWDQKINIMS